MSFTIAAALARIKTVEEGLSITSPVTQSIKHVYTYIPHQSAMPEVPCFMHNYALTSVQHFPGGSRKQIYTVTSQFLSGDADLDQAAAIASAFLAEWLDAFSNDLTLNGNCTGPIVVRGADPTLVKLDYAGQSWVGLDLLIELIFGPEGVTVGP